MSSYVVGAFKNTFLARPAPKTKWKIEENQILCDAEQSQKSKTVENENKQQLSNERAIFCLPSSIFR